MLKAKIHLSLQAKTGLGTQGQEELWHASAPVYILRIEIESICFDFEFEFEFEFKFEFEFDHCINIGGSPFLWAF